MKLASIQGISLGAVFRDAIGQFSPSFRENEPAARTSRSPRGNAPHVTDIVDDSYSEAINFRFEAGGRAHRGLVTYEALRMSAAEEAFASREPALALFIRHAEEIGESAAAKLEKDGMDPVVLADGDL